MEVFYINLADQTARRARVEESFAAARSEGWSLTRFEAVTAATVSAQPGALRDAQKACFLSHVEVLDLAQRSGGHALICEDDVLFGKTSCAAIDSAVARLPADGWDMLFTDLAPLSPSAMVDLFVLRRKLMPAGQIETIDLAGLPFLGATAAIVNRAAMAPLRQMLQQAGLDSAYDAVLARLIAQRQLRARFIFPFPTTLSELAEPSQVQPPQAAASAARRNAFRRLVWLERDADAVLRDLDGLAPVHQADDTAAFGRLLGAMLDPARKGK